MTHLKPQLSSKYIFKLMLIFLYKKSKSSFLRFFFFLKLTSFIVQFIKAADDNSINIILSGFIEIVSNTF